MYVYMYVCMYACMFFCMYACMYVCMYACMFVYMYVCTHVCMYVYIALALQHKIEENEDVERAFVHVDHLERNCLEHKVERLLVKGG